ncbi:MAG: A/G-specific adenine glycosylase [Pseudomonadota bacterium]
MPNTTKDDALIQDTATAIGHALVAWFEQAKRDLPWRKDYSPYGVWISEMMLQQTQMERGVAYFQRWMMLFPDIKSVAHAPEDALLKAWEGLGYYRRVRNVQAAAKTIMAEHGGIFPCNFEDIRKLSGIGDYTAGAIASIAFEQAVPAVDANVDRVFARLFDIDSPTKEKATAAKIRQLVMMAMPHGQARDFNQAIMELGALVCRKGPDCGHCPVGHYCESFRLGIVHERPILPAKKASIAMNVATGVLVHKGRIYVQKRMDVGLWAGFWELPGGRIESGETAEAAIVREFMEETGFAVTIRSKLAVVKHGYTSYRVTLHCFALELDEAQGISDIDGPQPTLTAATAYDWLSFDGLDTLTLPAGHRKLVDKLHRDMVFQCYLE